MVFTGHLEGLSEDQKSRIYKTIKQYCQLSDDEINIHYNRWKIYNRGSGHKNGYTEESFIDVNKIHAELKRNTSYHASCYGIDFPYWMDLGNEKKKKLLIVGINPNRELKDWKDFIKDSRMSLIINSGWGAHNNFEFDKQYKNFFLFLSDNFSFYFTDFQKLFYWLDYDGERSNSYKDKAFTNSTDELHKRILEQEINIVKPDAIIAFGNAVPKTLGLSNFYINDKIRFSVTNERLTRQEYNKIPFFHFPHLSKVVRDRQVNNFYNKNKIPKEVIDSGRGMAYAYIFKNTFN